MASKKASAQFGLTLIELLVAISILGLVAVMGWRGLDSIVRSRTALNADLEQTRGMQLTFAQLQNDAAQLSNAGTLPNRPALLINPDQITLVRTVNADKQATRLQVVSYQVLDGKLLRRTSLATRDLALLDHAWLAALNDTESAPAVTLQSGVASMSTRVWMKGALSWQPAVPPLATNVAAPIGLEVTLKMQGRTETLVKNFLLGAV